MGTYRNRRINLVLDQELEDLFVKASKVYEKKGLMMRGIRSQLMRQGIKQRLMEIIKKEQ